jgi:antitoxin ParD1/3/4
LLYYSRGKAMTTLTISLPESLKEFIDREVQTKGYGNVSEYVRGLLREAQSKEADARLEALLMEGLTTGEEIPLTPNFWSELKQDAAKILARHNQPGKVRSKP